MSVLINSDIFLNDIVVCACFSTLNVKNPVHCNCIFKRKCSIILKITKNLGKPHCNCENYSFRRTGISPPTQLAA